MAEAIEQDQVVPSLESGVDEVESEPYNDTDEVEVAIYKHFPGLIYYSTVHLLQQVWIGNNIKFSGVKYFLKKTDIHRKIFLIRYAEYYRNHDGHTELNQIGSLTPNGRIQAYNAGLYLKQSVVKPTVMFYSDLLRARQTAGAILNHFPDSLPILCHSLLQEVSYKITNSKVIFMVRSWY